MKRCCCFWKVLVLTWLGQRHDSGELSSAGAQRAGGERDVNISLSTSACHTKTKVFQVKLLGRAPDEVLAERSEGLPLVVTEHLEHDGLGLDVLHKRLGDFNSNLEKQRLREPCEPVPLGVALTLKAQDGGSYVLNVVEPQRRSVARVLQGFCGERLVMPVDEATQNNTCQRTCIRDRQHTTTGSSHHTNTGSSHQHRLLLPQHC